MDKISVMAPAKLNLSLDITGIDEKGYHLLDMVMQTVSIYEKITITKQDTITISSNARYIPTDAKNVAVKAAMCFFEYTKLSAGAHIHITKSVPIKAGMAGGSADAAGVILGLNKLYNTNLTLQQQCEIGLMAGSDIPFMLTGGTKRVQGTGEVILPCPTMPTCWFVICMPSRGVSTPEAFANYDKLQEKATIPTQALIEAIRQNNLPLIASLMANDLEKAAQSPATPIIKQQLLDQGALGSVMTGSGAAVFGIFDQEAKAKQAAAWFKGKVKSVFIARTVDHGAMIATKSKSKKVISKSKTKKIKK